MIGKDDSSDNLKREEYLLLKFYRLVYTISPATNQDTN